MVYRIEEKGEKVTVVSQENQYAVLLKRDDSIETESGLIEFTVILVSQNEENTVLYTNNFEHTSLFVACEIANRLKEHLLKPDVLLNLWARALAETLDFKVDPSKGVEYFFEEAAKHSSTELLNSYSEVVEYRPYKIAVDNELKSRGVN